MHLSQPTWQFESECRNVAKSGATVWVRNFLSTIPDAEERRAQIIALVTDITSRVRARRPAPVNRKSYRLRNKEGRRFADKPGNRGPRRLPVMIER